jgi:thiol-disulfide isomerase/thioredoxin
VKRHDVAWAERFAAEARRYFEATGKYRRLLVANAVPLAVAERTGGGAAKVLDEARATLAAAQQATGEPVFRDVLGRMLKDADQFRANRLENARRNAKIAGLPSPAWKAVDLDGTEHAVEQYRGRVLVLDFWFRQCSFCMRAMPQVEQAAQHFRQAKAPVAFLGASIDKDAADARHVAEKLTLSYPVLRAEAVAERYGIQGCPTLVVLDPQGNVQGIFVGYRPTMREELIQCIRELLAEAKGR